MNAAMFRVRGRVQGVAFRAHARREAQALGITGHACNLDDGTVEVYACGDAASIDAFARWLAQGPPLARVDGVSRADADAADAPADFRIG